MKPAKASVTFEDVVTSKYTVYHNGVVLLYVKIGLQNFHNILMCMNTTVS
jgi:hypothetical protein